RCSADLVVPVLFVPSKCMPKHIEGVFGRASCPEDASAQRCHSTVRWPAAGILLCPLSIIDEISSTTVKKRNVILRASVPCVNNFFDLVASKPGVLNESIPCLFNEPLESGKLMPFFDSQSSSLIEC